MKSLQRQEHSIKCLPNHICNLLCRSWYPHDVYATPMFEITLTINATILMASVVCAITITQVMFLSTLVQVIGQYRILRYNLSNIRTLAEKAVTSKALLKNKQRKTNTTTNITNECSSEPRKTLVENSRSNLHQHCENLSLETLSTQVIDLNKESLTKVIIHN